MSMVFNACEVLEMAKRIERNGEAFYRRAADLHSASAQREFLTSLADMEVVHERVFADLQRAMPKSACEETSYDPNGEAVLYLQSMSDMHGGEGARAATMALTGKETMEDILKTAIILERKSILFYLGIEDLVPERFGRESVRRVIAEEKSHVARLARELARVRA